MCHVGTTPRLIKKLCAPDTVRIGGFIAPQVFSIVGPKHTTESLSCLLGSGYKRGSIRLAHSAMYSFLISCDTAKVAGKGTA